MIKKVQQSRFRQNLLGKSCALLWFVQLMLTVGPSLRFASVVGLPKKMALELFLSHSFFSSLSSVGMAIDNSKLAKKWLRRWNAPEVWDIPLKRFIREHPDDVENRAAKHSHSFGLSNSRIELLIEGTMRFSAPTCVVRLYNADFRCSDQMAVPRFPLTNLKLSFEAELLMMLRQHSYRLQKRRGLIIVPSQGRCLWVLYYIDREKINA